MRSETLGSKDNNKHEIKINIFGTLIITFTTSQYKTICKPRFLHNCKWSQPWLYNYMGLKINMTVQKFKINTFYREPKEQLIQLTSPLNLTRLCAQWYIENLFSQKVILMNITEISCGEWKNNKMITIWLFIFLLGFRASATTRKSM